MLVFLLLSLKKCDGPNILPAWSFLRKDNIYFTLRNRVTTMRVNIWPWLLPTMCRGHLLHGMLVGVLLLFPIYANVIQVCQTYSPFVLTVAVRTNPSFSGWTSSTLASGYFLWDTLSSETSTMSPTCMGVASLCHLFLTVNWCKYSCIQCFQ